MFLSAMCDKKEEGGIRYRSFLKHFEPGAPEPSSSRTTLFMGR